MDIRQKSIHSQVKEEKKQLPDGTVKTVRKQAPIFPRYHQLDMVRELLAEVSAHGDDHNYLIRHSADSGKFNSIAWMGPTLTTPSERWIPLGKIETPRICETL
ncbi:MAG: hypothetical protein NC489_34370 [Ruminococcus flavefaciens]|nr:hypothetical protein [Ruminococcus flavefaciens]